MKETIQMEKNNTTKQSCNKDYNLVLPTSTNLSNKNKE